MIINVHAGHSLKCRGASGLLDEVNEDRKVKNKVIELLRANGHTVYDCTDDNGATQNANLKAIVSKCNDHKVDLDVSIHLNAGGGTGTEVYIYNSKSKAKDEATRIAEKVSNALGIRNRGVKTSTKLYVLRKTNSPALLVECCFVDNATDRAHWNADKCAKAIVEGILNKSVNEHVETPTPKPQTNTSNALGTYMITASDLIVRSTPAGSAVGHRGLSADGKAHDKDGDGALDKGTRITVSQISVSGNDIWGKCPSGWVCLKKGNSVYAVKDDSSSASTGSSSNANSATSKALGTYEVTASDLSVRTGPGANYRRKTYEELTKNAKAHDYDKDGCLNYGTRVTVSRFDGDWAKIPSGWVTRKYLKKV